MTGVTGRLSVFVVALMGPVPDVSGFVQHIFKNRFWAVRNAMFGAIAFGIAH